MKTLKPITRPRTTIKSLKKNVQSPGTCWIAHTNPNKMLHSVHPFVCRGIKPTSSDAEFHGLSTAHLVFSRQTNGRHQKCQKLPKTHSKPEKIIHSVHPFVCRGIKHTSSDAEFHGLSTAYLLLSRQTNGRHQKRQKLPKTHSKPDKIIHSVHPLVCRGINHTSSDA